MSADITERATPLRVTEWTIDQLQKHLAENCLCVTGDPCTGFGLLGLLTVRYVRDFNRAEGIDE